MTNPRPVLGLALLLAGCAAGAPPPSADGPPRPAYGLLSVPASQATFASASASSTKNAYFPVEHTTDRNVSTAWAPAPTDGTPSLCYTLAGPTDTSSASIKLSHQTGPATPLHVTVEVDRGSGFVAVGTYTPPQAQEAPLGFPLQHGVLRMRLRFDTSNLYVCEVRVFGTPTPASPSPSPTVTPTAEPTATPSPTPRAVVVTTVAGSGGAGSDNGPGLTATFNNPTGLVADALGNLYVADFFNNLVRRIDGTTHVVSTFAGPADFNNPGDVAIDAAGNLYVADYSAHRIREVTPLGVVTTFAGDGNPGLADGPAATAEFNHPAGLAFDSAGNLYVGDQGNNAIRKITPAGVVSTLASGAGFHDPTGVAVDASGTVYVADQSSNLIRQVTPSGTVTTLAGDGTQGFADGPAATAEFSHPTGVAVDAAGTLYVADFGNSRIRTLAAGTVSTLTGTTPGYADGPGATAQFDGPYGIMLHGANTLYVTDGPANRVRAISF